MVQGPPASAPAGLPGFQVKVPSAGTRVRFPKFIATEVTVAAFFKNSGYCVVGGDDVVASDSGSNGTVLDAGWERTWQGARIETEYMYVDSEISGDYVIVSYIPF